METEHPEGETPFVANEDSVPDRAGDAEDVSYVECPVDGCNEILVIQELDYHLELHSEESDHQPEEGLATASESDTKTETTPSGPSRAHRDAERQRRSEHGSGTGDRQQKAISAWKRLLKMPVPSSSHGILSSKRSREDKHKSGHSTQGRRLGVRHPHFQLALASTLLTD
jgi:hypothetical protein